MRDALDIFKQLKEEKVDQKQIFPLMRERLLSKMKAFPDVDKQELPSIMAAFQKFDMKPLCVKQRVLANLSYQRTLHTGSILTFDKSTYHILFDRIDLSVQVVHDFDLMPIESGENCGIEQPVLLN